MDTEAQLSTPPGPNSRQSLEEAFPGALIERFSLYGTHAGKVDIVRLKPNDPLPDQPPILVIPPYRLGPEEMQKIMEAAYNLRREVIAIRYSDQGKTIRGKNSFRIDHSKKSYTKEAQALLQVMNYCKIDQADALAGSHGGPVLAIAASQNPEKFRKLLLINSGGQIPNDTIDEVQKRTFQMFVDNKTMEEKRRKSLLRFNKLRFIRKREKHIFIIPMLDQFIASGHEVSIVASKDDTVIPSARIQLPNGVSLITIPGDHLSLLEEANAKTLVQILS